MKKYVFVGLAIISAAFFIYSYLGGGEQIILEEKDHADFPVLAEYFEGSYKDPALEAMFDNARQTALKKEVPMAILNLGNDMQAKKVYQWVGILSEDSLLAGDSVKFFRLKSESFLKTTIDSHNSVMPRPEDVREGASMKADSLGIALQNHTLEIYHPDGMVEVIFFSKSQEDLN